MGSLKVTVDCRVSGPLSDGTADKAMQDWAANTTQAIADKGVAMLRAVPMNKSGRAHGQFENALQTVRTSPTTVTIPGPSVPGVVFAPWLEGTSKRNEGSKFKGYHLFRKTRLALSKLAPGIAQAELDKASAQIGGT